MTQETNLSLGNDFPDADKKDWLDAVDKALRGAAYESLQSRHNGLNREPLYTNETVKLPKSAHGMPGQAPFLRGSQSLSNSFLPWHIASRFTPGRKGNGNEDPGNGAPSGAHYNLNVIGMDRDADDSNTNNGRRIFVDLNGNTRITLTEGDFGVIDHNGLDSGNGSVWNTSNAAPLIFPVFNASHNAFSSTLAPLPTLIKTADDFIFPNTFTPTTFSVSLVCGNANAT